MSSTDRGGPPGTNPRKYVAIRQSVPTPVELPKERVQNTSYNRHLTQESTSTSEIVRYTTAEHLTRRNVVPPT